MAIGGPTGNFSQTEIVFYDNKLTRLDQKVFQPLLQSMHDARLYGDHHGHVDVRKSELT